MNNRSVIYFITLFALLFACSVSAEGKDYKLFVYTTGQGEIKINPIKESYYYGEIVTLTAYPSKNNMFLGWTGDVTDTAYKVLCNMRSNRYVTAVFSHDSIDKYKMDVDIKGKGIVKISPFYSVYESGTLVTLTAKPYEEWVFEEWDDESSNNQRIVKINSYKLLTAYFESKYDVSHLDIEITGCGNISLNPSGGLYANGTVVTISAKPCDDWLLCNNKDEQIQITVKGDTSLSFEFCKDEPKNTLNIVSFPTGIGKVTVRPAGPLYEYGQVVTLYAIPDSGFVFRRWDGDIDEKQNPITITMTSNKTITAVFDTIEIGTNTPHFTLIIDKIGTGDVIIEPLNTVYDSGTVVTLIAVSSNWNFSKWNGNLSGFNDTIIIEIDSNINGVAVFQPPTILYTLTYNINGGGVLDIYPKQDYFYKGDTVLVVAVPDSNYVFAGWGIDTARVNDTLYIVMDANKELSVNFEYAAIGVPSNADIYNHVSIYPNPASGMVMIQFGLKEYGHVDISLYNTSGMLYKKIVDGIYHNGVHRYLLNMEMMERGIYYCVVTTGEMQITKKIILISR